MAGIRSCPAPSTQLLILTLPTLPLQMWSSQLVKDRGVFPYFRKFVVPDITGRERHIRTGGDLPIRRDAAIVRPCQTAAPQISLSLCNWRVRIFLIGDALKMGGAAGSDEHPGIFPLQIYENG